MRRDITSCFVREKCIFNIINLNSLIKLLFVEDEPEPVSIKDTYSVIQGMPWEETDECGRFKCPFCFVIFNNEENYFSHVQTEHALKKCDECGDLFNEKRQHTECRKYIH